MLYCGALAQLLARLTRCLWILVRREFEHHNMIITYEALSSLHGTDWFKERTIIDGSPTEQK